MRYCNIDTKEQAELIEENDKYKTVMLQLDNGRAISISTSTFHKKWVEIINTNNTMKED